MVKQANEWRIPIFVMDCDVAGAVDHVSHHLIIDAMEALKVPPVLVAAWITEYRGSETCIKLDDILTPGCAVHVRCHKVIRVQRICVEQPWMFQQQPFVKSVRQKSGSCPWVETEEGHCSLPTTAGFLAMSPAELKCTAGTWDELLEKAGLRIAWEEAVWCTSAPDSLEAKIVVDDTVITRRTREQGFKVLGAWITFDGHFVQELAEREVIAWRSFYATRKLMCDNKVALRHRLRLLSSCVTSSLYRCSGSWILTQSQCTHLRAIQDKLLRRKIYVPRHPTETPEAYMIRWSKLLQRLSGKAQNLTW